MKKTRDLISYRFECAFTEHIYMGFLHSISEKVKKFIPHLRYPSVRFVSDTWLAKMFIPIHRLFI